MNLIQHPHPTLIKKAMPVATFGRSVRKLVHKMQGIMYDYDGVGLAAPQVDESLKVFVWDDRRGHRGYIINPDIHYHTGQGLNVQEEGCLSVEQGKKYLKIPRWDYVRLEGYDIAGHKLMREAHGLLARIFQHEMDHLLGVLILSKESPKKPVIPIESPAKIRGSQLRGEA